MPTYRQIGRNEFPSTDPTRVGKMDVAYVYMDERLQTIMIQFPLEEDTAEKVVEELRVRAERAAAAGPTEVVIE